MDLLYYFFDKSSGFNLMFVLFNITMFLYVSYFYKHRHQRIKEIREQAEKVIHDYAHQQLAIVADKSNTNQFLDRLNSELLEENHQIYSSYVLLKQALLKLKHLETLSDEQTKFTPMFLEQTDANEKTIVSAISDIAKSDKRFCETVYFRFDTADRRRGLLALFPKFQKADVFLLDEKHVEVCEEVLDALQGHVVNDQQPGFASVDFYKLVCQKTGRPDLIH